MAQFGFSGMDELITAFQKSAEVPEEVKGKILTAMATVGKEAETAIGKEKNIYDPESSTHVLDSLKIGKPKITDDGGSVALTFSGTRTDSRHKKIRNAEIAFINEFGKKNQPARPFISTAIEKYQDNIYAAGEAELQKYIDSLFGQGE